MPDFLKQKKLLAVFATIALLATAFIWVLLSSGPLAKIKIVVTEVQERQLEPALFGIGTVEARHTYRIASNTLGRVVNLNVDVGARVDAGEILGMIDVVDLDEKINAQAALVESNKARLSEAQARLDYTGKQAARYRKLLPSRSVSEKLMRPNNTSGRWPAIKRAAPTVNYSVPKQNCWHCTRDATIAIYAHRCRV